MMVYTYTTHDKYLISCGSVGYPINEQIKAQFVQLEYQDPEWQAELITIPYDLDQIIADFEPSGLYQKANIWPRAVVKTLQTGKNYVILCIMRAHELAKAKNSAIKMENIPEDCWEKAAFELGLII